MKPENTHPIQKPKDNHRVARPTQTGFSSPATHYNEPRIDLNAVLAPNSEATFYIRVIDDSSSELGINKNDVLIVDKSLTPKNNQFAVAILEGNFQIVRINLDQTEEINVWGLITYIIKSVL
jgi:DNA polymerase V